MRFDWCSNRYRELAFPPDGPVAVRMRSDDHGSRRASLPQRPNAHPSAQLPLLGRGLDFGTTDALSFSVPVADSGAYVSARAIRTEGDPEWHRVEPLRTPYWKENLCSAGPH